MSGKALFNMSDKERAKLFPIILENHNPAWADWYICEKELIIGNIYEISNIHHYGSTSIPNLMAKPTIDILIEVEKSFDITVMKRAFEDIGYLYMPYGKEPDMLFVKGYTKNGFAKKVYHVHVNYKGYQHELAFRDYLIAHPEMAERYEQLKISLKEKYEFDRDGYTDAKTQFIENVLKMP